MPNGLDAHIWPFQKSLPEITSFPARVIKAAKSVFFTEELMKRTDPSAKHTFTPFA
jgi:hypothetical protein